MSFTEITPPVSPLLELRDLRVQFRTDGTTVEALRGVNLSMNRGEFVALVGESGSGKTTIANTIIGLLHPSATVAGGEVLLDGRNLAHLRESEYQRIRGRHIGLVPQDPGGSLDPVKTIGSQVIEIFRLHKRDNKLSRGEAHERALELLRLVGIDRPEVRMRQYPHELSGGLKQRVLIAMAFGLRPSLLIADEPTSALDVTVQKQVLEVFDDLVARFGTTVIFVTHDLAVATDHASRVVVMRGGEVVEDKPVQKILTEPEHEYTVRLIEEALPRFGSDPSALQEETQTALAVRNLVKEFHRGGSAFRAVDDVSFDVPAGTTLSLVGESGSGKSTTTRLAMRLLAPTSGNIMVFDTDVTDATSKHKRELWRTIQLVYQNPDSALDPRLTIESIIAEPLRSFRIGSSATRRARVRELLDYVALPQTVLRRRPRELSGGQRQRVAIARALASDARIVVLDEALSALDVLTQAQILELLERLQTELGLTYLFISHDLSVVREISDTVAVMQRGRVVESGPVQQIFDSPQHEYTQTLLASNPGHRLAQISAGRTRPPRRSAPTGILRGEGDPISVAAF